MLPWLGSAPLPLQPGGVRLTLGSVGAMLCFVPSVTLVFFSVFNVVLLPVGGFPSLSDCGPFLPFSLWRSLGVSKQCSGKGLT